MTETKWEGLSPFLVASYLLHLAGTKGRRLTPMQAQKLVYLAHGWMLGLYGKPLIDEDVEAWQYGPVIPSVYHRFKKYGRNYIQPPKRTPEIPDEERKNLVDRVYEVYCDYNGLELSSMSHTSGSPWDIVHQGRPGVSVIPNDLIETYFRRVAEKRNDDRRE